MNRIIKFETISKKISSLGGIFLLKDLSELLSLDKLVSSCLPSNIRNTSFDKFMAIYYSFAAGAENLDDIAKLSKDVSFSNITKLHDPVTYGRFIKDFDKTNTDNLRTSLTKQAIRLRRKSFGLGNHIVFDIDSSKHKQYSKKMEGVEYDGYSKTTCLDSIVIYDEHGFEYWFDLRPGATHTSVDASYAIESVVNLLPESKTRTIYIRADNGYANTNLYHTCYTQGLKFVSKVDSKICNQYKTKVTSWSKEKEKNKKIYFKDGREAELGSTLYYPDGSPEALRLVFMRAKKNKEKIDQYNMLEEEKYDYYCFVTNISSRKWKNRSVILFYRKRGHAENFIREAKNGYDLHHFPCKEINANRVYGLIAGFAYNSMRFIGTLINKNHVPFAKRIRFLLINLPCQVVNHARSTSVRYEQHIYEEVMRIRQKLHLSFQLIFEN